MNTNFHIIRWGIVVGIKMSSNVTTISNVPPPSHNVTTKWEHCYQLKIEDNQCFDEKQLCMIHHYWATPRKLFSAFVLKVEPNILLNIFAIVPEN